MPAALVSAFIEGLLFQSMIQGTGLALLEFHLQVLKPVFVNDSAWAMVEVTGIRSTSKGNRAIVTSRVEVFNQRDENVMTYDVVRMLAGRDSIAEATATSPS